MLPCTRLLLRNVVLQKNVQRSRNALQQFVTHRNHVVVERMIPSSAQIFTTCRQIHLGTSFFQNQVSTNFNVQDEDEFHEKVIKAPGPMIVDFHAEWCGPCKVLGPKLETAVDNKKGKVLLAKVDVDDHGLIAMKYKIMAVPTVMLFKNGEVVDKFEGNIEDKDLEIFMNKAIK